MLPGNPIPSKILRPSSLCLWDIGILKGVKADWKDVSELGEPAAAGRIFELYQIAKRNLTGSKG